MYLSGVYHALRLREGIDSGLSPKKRKESIYNFLEAVTNSYIVLYNCLGVSQCNLLLL